ncbi:hypothetical protein [Planctellipticum variicoloris]
MISTTCVIRFDFRLADRRLKPGDAAQVAEFLQMHRQESQR